jgi:hypothetical protein
LWQKFGADEFAAQCGEHVAVADGLLVRVPGSAQTAGAEVAVGVAVELVPDDRQRLAEEAERDGALDGALDAVAGLADAVGFALLEAGLDRPAAGIASDQLRGGASVSVEAIAMS